MPRCDPAACRSQGLNRFPLPHPSFSKAGPSSAGNTLHRRQTGHSCALDKHCIHLPLLQMRTRWSALRLLRGEHMRDGSTRHSSHPLLDRAAARAIVQVPV